MEEEEEAELETGRVKVIDIERLRRWRRAGRLRWLDGWFSERAVRRL